LSDEELRSLFADIRQASPDIAFRLCTRAPVVLPSRISNEFVAMCASFKPLRLSIHLNHPDELTSECRHALSCFVNAGIPVLVQTVLLRGINDSVDTLTCLFRQCLSLGLQPYYLFQLDLARGTKHFRVPLEEGLELYDRVKEGLSPVPPYAVDLPGGGGKIRLSKEIIAGIIATEKGRFYQLRDKDGRLWLYPAF
jgi:lysine 2,3-aminomutase